MNKTQQILKSREEEFDKKFTDPIYCEPDCCGGKELYRLMKEDDPDISWKIKSFHATTISLLLTSLKEEVEKLTTTGVYKVDHQREIRVQKPEYTGGYNDAVSDISTFISETISNIQTNNMFKETPDGQTHHYCPHGRIDGIACPHCMGINAEPEKKNHCKKCGNNIPDHFNTCEESGFGDGCGVTFREPEKKDVWEAEFDKKFPSFLTPICPIDGRPVPIHDGWWVFLQGHHQKCLPQEIKNFIRQNFISRAECKEKCLDQYAMGQSEGMSLADERVRDFKAEVVEKVKGMKWEIRMEELKGQIKDSHHYVRVKNVNAKLLKLKSDLLTLLTQEK